MAKDDTLATAEILRIKAEYARREREIDPDLYAPLAASRAFGCFGTAKNRSFNAEKCRQVSG